ncbi:hypothetical protein HRH25_11435 [Flavisolibacter sp. BT320]|nr:hypothetical protein [Flavisolibacter longurius]
MKQLLFLLPCFVIVIFSTAKSQKMAKPTATKSIRLHAETPKKIASESILLKFHEDYPTVTDDAWATTEKGYLVSFSLDEIKYTVFLDHRGIKTSQIRYDRGRLLPEAARKKLKENFPCFKIGWVKEITTLNGIAHQVRIENDWEWKVLKINEEEMDIMEVYKKD